VWNDFAIGGWLRVGTCAGRADGIKLCAVIVQVLRRMILRRDHGLIRNCRIGRGSTGYGSHRARRGWRAGAQCGSESSMIIDSTQIVLFAAARRAVAR
jgi:hypothetical protein